MKLVTISPKGQITIPKSYRDKIKMKQYTFETQGTTIVLKPMELKEAKSDTDELATAAISNFKFWEDPSNDIYAQLL